MPISTLYCATPRPVHRKNIPQYISNLNLRKEMATSNKKGSRDEVYMVALLGITGAGKTTFAQHASGDMSLKIGHSIYSCKLTQGRNLPKVVEA